MAFEDDIHDLVGKTYVSVMSNYSFGKLVEHHDDANGNEFYIYCYDDREAFEEPRYIRLRVSDKKIVMVQMATEKTILSGNSLANRMDAVLETE